MILKYWTPKDERGLQELMQKSHLDRHTAIQLIRKSQSQDVDEALEEARKGRLPAPRPSRRQRRATPPRQLKFNFET